MKQFFAQSMLQSPISECSETSDHAINHVASEGLALQATKIMSYLCNIAIVVGLASTSALELCSDEGKCRSGRDTQHASVCASGYWQDILSGIYECVDEVLIVPTNRATLMTSTLPISSSSTKPMPTSSEFRSISSRPEPSTQRNDGYTAFSGDGSVQHGWPSFGTWITFEKLQVTLIDVLVHNVYTLADSNRISR